MFDNIADTYQVLYGRYIRCNIILGWSSMAPKDPTLYVDTGANREMKKSRLTALKIRFRSLRL